MIPSQKQVLLARPMAVLTPVISSLTGAVRSYAERLFPEGYFADRYVDTELPARPGHSRRRHFRPMTYSQISARNTPLLTIKVDPTADASELSAGDAWSQGNRFLDDPVRLNRLIVDDQAGRFLGVYFERAVCRFSVNLSVNSDMQAYDAMMYLKRLAPVNRKTFLNDISVSTELPPDVMRTIWVDLGLGDGSILEDFITFHRYLDQTTGGRVDRVVNSMTGRNVFSFRYAANPVMNITSSPSVNVNRDGAVVRGATVELQLEMDLPVPMAYSYRQDGPLPVGSGVVPEALGATESRVYFGTSTPAQPSQTLRDGQSLVFRTSIISGPLDPKAPLSPDVTSVAPYVPQNVKDYIGTLRLLKDGSTKITAQTWMDGTMVSTDDVSFDWRTWELILRKPRHSYQYDLCLYCDLSEYSRLIPQGSRHKPPEPFFEVPTLEGKPYGPNQTYT
jgi:hypothetical protein